MVAGVGNLQPAIEGAVLQKQSQLVALSRSITEAAKPTSPAFDVPTAELLLARIEVLAAGARDRQPRSSSSGPEDGDRGDDESHLPDTTRLSALAPSLTRVLGERQAAMLAEGLDDNKLRTVEGLAYSGDLTRSKTSHPALDPLLQEILQELAQSSAFTGEAKSTFSLFVQQTLLFLFSGADPTTKTLGWPKKKDYRRLLKKGEKKPVEEDLQQDYHQWLATGPLAGLCAVEMSDVATGR